MWKALACLVAVWILSLATMFVVTDILRPPVHAVVIPVLGVSCITKDGGDLKCNRFRPTDLEAIEALTDPLGSLD